MTSTPNRCSSMTTSLPSSPEPSSKTRVALALLGVPIETMRGTYHADLSLQSGRYRPVWADVIGLHILAGQPHRCRAGILRAVEPVLRNRTDPDLFALGDAVSDARRIRVLRGEAMPVVALAREHDPVVVATDRRRPVRPRRVEVYPAAVHLGQI